MLRALEAEYNISHQRCPSCGARGGFKKHGKYTRHLIKLILGIPLDTIIEIRRVRCCSCKVTHAIIPFDVVPYCQHSTTLDAEIFDLRYRSVRVVSDICGLLAIPTTTYYRIHRRSIGRLLTLASMPGQKNPFGSLFEDVEELVVSHLGLLKVKPFESGRLAPAFFDT